MKTKFILPVFAVIASLAVIFSLSAFKSDKATSKSENVTKVKQADFVFVKTNPMAPDNLYTSYTYSEGGTECGDSGSSICAVGNDDDDQLTQQELDDILDQLDGQIYKRTP